ncbi:MAG: hypothetical protein CM1200mP2_08530 [Planctomycetaceae bacterium]|nr:MAG: hypothetical protein CM1200mP2_08530 [Planctomycetaceae bacterium]
MKNGTFKYYHGLGVGDVNRDGRTDVVIPHGWWEAPAKPTDATGEIFHPLHLAPDAKSARSRRPTSTSTTSTSTATTTW